MGLLFRGTGDKALTERMLAQFSMLPDKVGPQYRELWSIISGFSLGLICLGRGGDNDMSYLQASDILLGHIHGNPPLNQRPTVTVGNQVSVELCSKFVMRFYDIC